jgi:hypothetical protein
MNDSTPNLRNYLLAGALGALCGGVLVALATRSIPKMMSGMMSEMMAKMPPMMMARMKAEGFNPSEMCQQMGKMFAEVSVATETAASGPGKPDACQPVGRLCGRS